MTTPNPLPSLAYLLPILKTVAGRGEVPHVGGCGVGHSLACADGRNCVAALARVVIVEIERLDALRGERLISADDVHEARLAGWRAGIEAAASTCAVFAQRAGGDIAEGAAVCEESIRAILDPPSQEKAK